MKFCMQCGAELSEEAKYCRSCGAKVNSAKTHGNAKAPDTEGDVKAPDTESDILRVGLRIFPGSLSGPFAVLHMQGVEIRSLIAPEPCSLNFYLGLCRK